MNTPRLADVNQQSLSRLYVRLSGRHTFRFQAS